jgi:hypothetical protein
VDAERARAELRDIVVELSLYRERRRSETLAESRRSHPSAGCGVPAARWHRPTDAELRADARWGTSNS